MLSNVKFFAGVAVYLIAIWAIMSYVPMLSIAAYTAMTPRLWFYEVVGFFFGVWLGSAVVFMFRGARPLAYGRWDCSRERPSSLLGDIIGIILASGVGIFCANAVLEHALKHP